MKGEFKGKTLQFGETVASAERSDDSSYALVRLCQNPLCRLTLKCPLPYIAFADWLFQLLMLICIIFSLLLLPHCMLHCERAYLIAFLNKPVSLCVTVVLFFVPASLKESPRTPLSESDLLSKIVDEIRKQVGVVFSQDRQWHRFEAERKRGSCIRHGTVGQSCCRNETKWSNNQWENENAAGWSP